MAILQMLLRAVIIPLIMVFVCIALDSSPLQANLELFQIETLFSLRGPRDVPKSVTVVRIDSRSFRRLDRNFFAGLSFSEYATILEKVTNAGAKLVIFDVLFNDMSSDQAGEQRFLEALSGSPSVIGRATQSFVDTDLDGKQTLSLERINPPHRYVENVKAVTPMLISITNSKALRISVIDEFSSFPTEKISLLKPLREFVSPDIVEPGYYDLINYYGPPYGIPDVPAYKLLDPNESVPEEFFKDRIVFIGAVDLPMSSVRRTNDSSPVPVSNVPMWGVEIHATIAENLLDKSWIRALEPRFSLTLSRCIVALLVFVFLKVSLRRAWILWASLSALWFGASYSLFAYWQFFLPGILVFAAVLPLFLVLLTIAGYLRRT